MDASNTLPDNPATVPADPQLPWRRIALQAAGMWLATRIALALVTYVAVSLFTTGFDPDKMGLQGPIPPAALLASWQRWDTDWYLIISARGYSEDALRTAFFPLFPLLIHIFTFLGDHTRLMVALLISNLGGLAAFIGVGLVAAQEDGPDASPYAIGALAAYPFAFFTAAAYPDGMFLGLAAFSLFSARRGAWGWAAVCAFLAALARPTGVILVLPLAWEYARRAGWLSRRWRERVRLRSLLKAAMVVGAVPLAVGLYAGYLWYTFGNPLTFLEVQSHWAHQFVPIWDIPWMIAKSVLNQPAWTFQQARLLIDVVPILVFTALTVASARRLPVSFTLYMAGTLFVTLASPIVPAFDPFISASRYLLAAFPAFILLGRWTRRHAWLHMLIMSGGFMLQGVLAGFFLMGGWII